MLAEQMRGGTLRGRYGGGMAPTMRTDLLVKCHVRPPIDLVPKRLHHVEAVRTYEPLRRFI
jgi:hypothetical protein